MTTANKQPTTVIPADHIPGPRQGQWTYAHYATIPDDGIKYEVIDGVLYMSPAPRFPHQSICNLIATYLTMHVQFTGLGRVLPAPFDVELSFHTVVQPDVLVLLNESLGQLTESHLIGKPDLVVEVASPSTAKYDRKQKRAVYERAGVREYWLVEPNQQTVEVLILEQGRYTSIGIFSDEQIILSTVVPDFPVQAKQLFA